MYLDEVEPTETPAEIDFGWIKSLLLDMAAVRSVDALLAMIVERIARQPKVALVRIWLTLPADICAACPMRSECASQTRCLHLLASAGNPRIANQNWSSLQGAFRRVPIGARQIGYVAAHAVPVKALDLEQNARRIARPDWLRRENISGFVGQPMIHNQQVLGVLGGFMRRNPVDEELSWWRTMADHAASAIANARAFEEIERLRNQLALENEYLRDEIKASYASGDMIGKSPALQNAMKQVALVAPTDSNVLILGESGTGKELFARAIHDRSKRAKRAMIKVNCASVPRELFESEFFGHVKGAFTGAFRNRTGRFELADGGTLFLDEVGEIPLDMQGKLLRVLQEGVFERIGEESSRSVDVRIVAATNRDLSAMVAAGLFREDLYYRLSVFPIEIAPLRERRDDIALLTEHFLTQQCRRLGIPKPTLGKGHIETLTKYDWPGNIRELQNAVERAVIISRGEPLRFSLPNSQKSPTADADADRATEDSEPAALDGRRRVYTYEELKQLERDNVVAVLKRANWKIAGPGGAAEFLGIHPATLSSRMRAMGIERPRRWRR